MRVRVLGAVGIGVFLAAPAVRAQETTIFATYYRCDQAREDRADAIFKELNAPALKAEVAAGHISAHGWARHWEGGEWRRLSYMSGTDLDKMVDAREAVIAKVRAAENAKASAEFLSICPSHDDYIWSSVASSQPGETVGTTRSAVGMSTYYQCDSREKEADAIVKSAFAPIMNQHVKDGKIARWNWIEHRMGGKYRRALILDGADHKSMLKYWGLLSPALDKEQPELARRFTEICGSHSDYIWDLVAN